MKTFAKVVIGGALVLMYGHLSRCLGYTEGVVVTAKAYTEKRIKDKEEEAD